MTAPGAPEGSVPPKPRRSTLGRWARRLGCSVLVLLSLGMVTAAGVAGWVLGTERGNEWLRTNALALAQPPHGTIAVDGLDTNLYSGATLTGVSVQDAEGHELYGADRIEVSWSLGGLLRRRLLVHELRGEGLRVHLRDGATCFDPAAPWAADAPDTTPGAGWSGLGFDLDIEAVDIDASLVTLCAGQPWGVTTPHLTGAVSFVGREILADVYLTGTVTEPAWGALDLVVKGMWDGDSVDLGKLALQLGPNQMNAHGTITNLRGDGQLALAVESLAVEPASLGVSGLKGPLTLAGALSGGFRTPSLRGDIATPGGNAAVVGALDLSAERPSWSASIDTPGLALDAFIADLAPTSLAGHVDAIGQGFGWPDDLDVVANTDLHAAVIAGQAGPYHARGQVTLHNGELTAQALALAAPGTSATVDGVVRFVPGNTTLTVRALDVDLASLRAYGVEGASGHVRYTGSLALDWSKRLAVAAKGRIAGERVGWGDSVAAATVSGPVDIRFGSGGVALRGTLGFGGLVASGAVVDRIDVDADITLPTGGGVQGRVHGKLGSAAYDVWHIDGGDVALRFSGPTVRLATTLEQQGRTWLAAVGDVALDPVVVDLNWLALAPPGGGPWLNDGPVHLRMEDGAVRDLSLVMKSGGARLEARGDIDPNGSLKLAVEAAGFPLAAVASLYPGALVGWAGALDATVAVGGRLADPSLTLEGTVTGLEIPESVHALDLTAAIRTVPEGLAVEAAFAGPTGRLGTLTGTAPVFLDLPRRGLQRDAPVALQLVLTPGLLGRLTTVLPGVEVPELRASAAVDLTGTLRAPVARIVASAAVPTGGSGAWLLYDVDAETHGDRVDLRGLVRERLERRGEVSGSVGFDLAAVAAAALGEGAAVDWGNPVALITDVELDVVPLQLPLAALVGDVFPDIRGSLLGGFHVSGSPLAPRLEGAVLVLDGGLGEVTVTSAQLTIAPQDDAGYDVDLNVALGDAGGVRVQGRLPIRSNVADFQADLDKEGLEIQVDAASTDMGLPLSVFSSFLPGIQDAEGRVLISGKIVGSVRSPRPDLKVKLNGGALGLRSTGVRYHDIHLDAKVDAEALIISKLELSTSPLFGGRGVVEGLSSDAQTSAVSGRLRVGHDGYTPSEFAGKLAFKRARFLELPARRLRLTGDVVVGGTWPNLSFASPQLAVEDGHMALPESYFTGSTELQLDPRIDVRRRGIDRAVAVVEEPFPMPNLDLHVELNRAVDIDASMPTEQVLGDLGAGLSTLRVQADLDGILDIQTPNAELQVSGSVEPLRGKATVLGRPFEITDGQVTFSGRDYARPYLDVTAVYATPGHGNITVQITGTADAPLLAFSGDEYPTQDDIVAILLFGAPLSQLDATAGSQALMAAVMAGLKGGVVGSDSLRGLDVLELGLGGATRVGKRIGRNVLVVLTWNPAADLTVTPPENVVEVDIEVQVPKVKWLLVATTGTSGRSTLSAVRKWRF